MSSHIKPNPGTEISHVVEAPMDAGSSYMCG